MAIIVILIAVAVPFYQKSIMRAKETVLHNNLFAMRNAIDEYTYDKQKAPQSSAGSGDRRISARRSERSDHGQTEPGRSSWKMPARRSARRSRVSSMCGAGRMLKSSDGTSYADW